MGSGFLAALACAPAVVEATTGLTTFRGFAGTSILILVGVATDTVRALALALCRVSTALWLHATFAGGGGLAGGRNLHSSLQNNPPPRLEECWTCGAGRVSGALLYCVLSGPYRSTVLERTTRQRHRSCACISSHCTAVASGRPEAPTFIDAKTTHCSSACRGAVERGTGAGKSCLPQCSRHSIKTDRPHLHSSQQFSCCCIGATNHLLFLHMHVDQSTQLTSCVSVVDRSL